MQVINKYMLGTVFVLIVVLLFVQPLNYIYHRLSSSECVKLDGLCIGMKEGWYKDIQSEIMELFSDSDRDIVTMSKLNGLKRAAMANFIVVKPINIDYMSEYKNEYEVLNDTIGDVLIVSNKTLGKMDGKVRMYLPRHGLLIVSDSDTVLYDIVRIQN